MLDNRPSRASSSPHTSPQSPTRPYHVPMRTTAEVDIMNPFCGRIASAAGTVGCEFTLGIHECVYSILINRHANGRVITQSNPPPIRMLGPF